MLRGTIKRPARLAFKAALLAAAACGTLAGAQEACPNRGELVAAYCDANKDLAADTPSDAKKP